jgi:hypothetical protein
MAAVKKRKEAKQKKIHPKAKKATPKTRVVYVKDDISPGFGDMTKMAMDGAVFMGSMGLMTGMAGTMATAFKK